MTAPARRRLDGGLLAEWLGVAAVLASVVWVIAFFAVHHYLPQPFVYDTADTFMDWFNPAQYANNPGAYDVWHSIYLPLSFLFLRVFSIHQCYISPFFGRDCDWLGQISIIILYILNCIVAFKLLLRADRATALPRGLAFALGFPMLFCLERGNLILACLPAFMIVYSNTVRSRFGRALAVALTINFKQYLLIPSLALAIKRDWRTLELSGFATSAIYILSLSLFGSGNPIQILLNTEIYSKLNTDNFLQSWVYSTSYSTLLTIQNSQVISVTDFLPSQLIDAIAFGVPMVILFTQAIGVIAIIAAWLQPEDAPLPRIAALFIGIYLVSSSPNGYVLTFLTFLVFLERGRRGGQAIALFCTYIQAITYDVMLTTVLSADQVSWLSGMTSQTSFGLAIGQFVRPGLLIITIWALSYDTITQSILAHYRQRPSLGLMPA